MTKASERRRRTRPPRPRRAGDQEGVGSLEALLLGAEPSFDAVEVAAASGVEVDQAKRLWRALGFPEHGQARAYTEADIAALRRLAGAVDRGLLDLDLAVTVTRAVGQTMARLADWEVGALVHHLQQLEQAGADTGDSGADSGAVASRQPWRHRLVAEFAEPFEQLLLYAWRRHLAASVARLEAMGGLDEDAQTTHVSVGFADIVGFTALSNQLSRARIGDLVELFESRCDDVVAQQGGRVIKSLGDSVLFVNDDPVRAYDTAEGIIAVVGRDPRMPEVRVGLASGAVVTRLGDVFGPPVNMAARLVAVARRNRIIVDTATAELLPPDQFETRPLPARPVRGFGLVEPVAVRRH